MNARMILEIALFVLAASQPKMMINLLRRLLVQQRGNQRRNGHETRSSSLRLIRQLRRCVALDLNNTNPAHQLFRLHTDPHP
jgi:hypothetical protein